MKNFQTFYFKHKNKIFLEILELCWVLAEKETRSCVLLGTSYERSEHTFKKANENLKLYIKTNQKKKVF